MKTKTNAQTHLNTTKYVPRIDKYYEKAQEQKRYQQKKIAKFKTTDEPLYKLSQQPILK